MIPTKTKDDLLHRMASTLAEMTGAAEIDLLGEKSNVWRSALIEARGELDTYDKLFHLKEPT